MTMENNTHQHSIPANRSDLLQIFADTDRRFAEVQEKIDNQERLLFSELEQVGKTVVAEPVDNRQEGEFAAAFEPRWQQMKKQVADWQSQVKDHERNTVFRHKFGDSLLVFAYGKVKAGKSSLGNFIAFGQHNPDQQCVDNAIAVPEFFHEDETGADRDNRDSQNIRQNGSFRVDTLEATSSIQGFTLPGLTWVDVPGLDSLTEENGRLAQKYVKAADLVLFLTHSSSPCRRSELERIAGLLGEKKPLAVVITACDVYDEDEVDGQIVSQLVMKPASDLDEQKNWVKGEINSLDKELLSHLADTDIHAISIRYAEENQGRKGWQESGMAGFAGQISAIAAGEGLRLKEEVPLRNLQAFAGNLLKSIKETDSNLNDMKTMLDHDQQKFRKLGERLATRVNQDMNSHIDKMTAEHLHNDKSFAEAVEKKIPEAWQEIVVPAINEHCADLAEGIDAGLARFQNIDLDLPGFKRHEQTVSTDGKSRIGQGAVTGATVGGAMAATTTTTTVASFAAVGATVVGSLGMGIGAVIGAGVGLLLSNKPRQYKVEVGDNRFKVAAASREAVAKIIEKEIAAQLDIISRTLHHAPGAWIEQTRHAIDRVRSQAVEIKNGD